MVGMLVPLKGGIGSIFHPPEGKDYMWYDIPANWGMDYATYHPLGEPETTIDIRDDLPKIGQVTIIYLPNDYASDWHEPMTTSKH